MDSLSKLPLFWKQKANFVSLQDFAKPYHVCLDKHLKCANQPAILPFLNFKQFPVCGKRSGRPSMVLCPDVCPLYTADQWQIGWRCGWCFTCHHEDSIHFRWFGQMARKWSFGLNLAVKWSALADLENLQPVAGRGTRPIEAAAAIIVGGPRLGKDTKEVTICQVLHRSQRGLSGKEDFCPIESSIEISPWSPISSLQLASQHAMSYSIEVYFRTKLLLSFKHKGFSMSALHACRIMMF